MHILPRDGQCNPFRRYSPGRLVAAVKPAGPDELLLTFAGQNEAVGWSQQQDIFSAMRDDGVNSAVVGWYHPYCRVIGERLNKCFWQPASQLTNPEKFSTRANAVGPGGRPVRAAALHG